MKTSREGYRSDQELEPLILEVLRKSAKPLHAQAIIKQMPRLYRVPEPRAASLLSDLADRQVVFAWGTSGARTLYATISLHQHARQSILQVLQEPLALPQIKAKAKTRLSGYPAAKASKLIEELVKEMAAGGSILKHPKSGEMYERPPTMEEAMLRLRQQFSHLRPEMLREAVLRFFTSVAPLRERILQEIESAEPRAQEGALASIPQVRKQLSPGVPKQEFDSALLQLGRDGVLSIHEFYGHLQIGEQEREELVSDESGGYYGGVTFQRR